jgi:hypothetical protein
VKRLTAKCYHKCGQWLDAYHRQQAASTSAAATPGGIDAELSTQIQMKHIRSIFEMAVQNDRNWYKAWHSLASANFASVLYYKDMARRFREAEKQQRQLQHQHLPSPTQPLFIGALQPLLPLQGDAPTSITVQLNGAHETV